MRQPTWRKNPTVVPGVDHVRFRPPRHCARPFDEWKGSKPLRAFAMKAPKLPRIEMAPPARRESGGAEPWLRPQSRNWNPPLFPTTKREINRLQKPLRPEISFTCR